MEIDMGEQGATSSPPMAPEGRRRRPACPCSGRFLSKVLDYGQDTQSVNALPPVLPHPGTDMVEAESALLAIGVEDAFYRKGIGQMLMLEAIEFASRNHIEWIDLSVFGDKPRCDRTLSILGI